MKIGDLAVYHSNNEDQLVEVLGFNYGMVFVEFLADKDRRWVREGLLELFEPGKSYGSNKKCECGIEKASKDPVPARSHFRWCAKYKD